MKATFLRRLVRHTIWGALAFLSLGAVGCNIIDAVQNKPVKIVKMVPGGNVATGGLDCWLTLDIRHVPEGVDPTDVKVRFSSQALARPAEFDWAYIAENDVLPSNGQFGRGHQPAPASQPGSAPPVGELKIKFPLEARAEIEDAPSTLWLEAEVLWGGQRIDDDRQTIEHVYSRTGNGFF